ncbi:expressed unknown protein [Seminavis robusta]|uniref:Uncharacterized protein n=1 Tax=Seminavis robusta TaxID=568900 RepID=A0A9N8HAU1_9STRA|nr:expressed unknown protein [Seminavis robusta]|eukprot:Sro160_g072150.1 n/a (277) ;mRNA; f:48776-49606
MTKTSSCDSESERDVVAPAEDPEVQPREGEECDQQFDLHNVEDSGSETEEASGNGSQSHCSSGEAEAGEAGCDDIPSSDQSATRSTISEAVSASSKRVFVPQQVPMPPLSDDGAKHDAVESLPDQASPVKEDKPKLIRISDIRPPSTTNSSVPSAKQAQVHESTPGAYAVSGTRPPVFYRQRQSSSTIATSTDDSLQRWNTSLPVDTVLEGTVIFTDSETRRCISRDVVETQVDEVINGTVIRQPDARLRQNVLRSSTPRGCRAHSIGDDAHSTVQ